MRFLTRARRPASWPIRFAPKRCVCITSAFHRRRIRAVLRISPGMSFFPVNRNSSTRTPVSFKNRPRYEGRSFSKTNESSKRVRSIYSTSHSKPIALSTFEIMTTTCVFRWSVIGWFRWARGCALAFRKRRSREGISRLTLSRQHARNLRRRTTGSEESIQAWRSNRLVHKPYTRDPSGR